jgi:hypothetical protein
MKVHGACHCGQITFEAEVDPDKTSVCHCTDCQMLSGAPYRASVAAAPAGFRVLTGELASYVKVADSGNRRVQTFCSRCGSPIYSTAEGDPTAMLNIRLGVVRQRNELTPKRQIWTHSRQQWTTDLSAIPEQT